MKQILLLILVLASITHTQNLTAQANFYHEDTIQEIRIYFEQDNWDYLLDSLYVDGEKERIICSMVINGTALDSVGIRYKGFSSVSTDRLKNPFNIKLDYVIDEQNYDGINKIKLSNVIQDPSFLREVLSYEIGRKYMPASRANFANVYINDELWGLYTNVEAVNKDFTAQHYGSRDNSFFKCNPAELDFDGENANLGNSHGTDTTAYYEYYDMESDDGWTDLYELIDILNENPDNIESILNVDRTLWMHAFNYALVNFDSYIGYAQNYYIYQDDNGLFNPIIWDLNQSFASYRLTDASEFFDGFNIEQAKTIDPLFHYSSISIYPRPLMRNLFENDTYRRMYIAHLRTIIEENFANQDYAVKAQYLQNLIEAAVLADANKFYTDDDFYNNLNSTVSDLVDYPGITDLMDARTEYLQDYPGYEGAPTIGNIAYSPSDDLAIGDDLFITTEITDVDATNVILAYRFGGNGVFEKLTMLDDGTQNDGAANDGIYGIQISDIGSSVQYYIYAENETAGKFSPKRAAYEYHLIQLPISPMDVVINELMAANTSTVSDEAGEFDDWIELYNTTNFDISTAGLYLSDDAANLQKWALPDVLITANNYLAIWADGSEQQGALHAGFKLSSAGETLFLVNENSAIIDSVSFGEQTADVSFGRLPNGTGPFTALLPTFNRVNNFGVGIKENTSPTIHLFPNPAKELLYVHFETGQVKPNEIQIYSIDGKLLHREIINSASNFSQIKTSNFTSGLYFLNLVYDTAILNRKLIISH